MATLVQVPWQPTLYLTPDTLDLLIRAGNRLGVKLYIYMAPDGPTDGAWRSWDRQNFLYHKALAGGNVASNPNSGQRMHMRGGAFDLVRTDAAVQAACRAVGLIRDPSESWHWNNPRMTSMPIIPTLTTTSGGSGTPITPDPVIETKPQIKEYDNMILVNCTDIASQPGGAGDVSQEGQNRYVAIAPGWFSIFNDKSLANTYIIAQNAQNPDWILRGQAGQAAGQGKATDWSSVPTVSRQQLADLLWNFAGWGGNTASLVNGFRWSENPNRAWN